MSCALANSGSISAKTVQWKARSQAAYQGYSHLSGMEMMSALTRCVQSLSRPLLREAGGFGMAGVAGEPAAHVHVVVLLGPQHAGEGLALHEARVGLRDVGLHGGVEAVGLVDAAAEHGVVAGLVQCRCLGRGEAEAQNDLGAGVDAQLQPGGAFGAAVVGVHRAVIAGRPRGSLMPSLKYPATSSP